MASILATIIEQVQPKHYAPWERPHPLPPPPSRQRERLLAVLRVLVLCLFTLAFLLAAIWKLTPPPGH